MVDNKKSRFSKNFDIKEKTEKKENNKVFSKLEKPKIAKINERSISKNKKNQHDVETQTANRSKSKLPNPHNLLYGKHAVNAALENPNRVLKVLYVTPSKQAVYEPYYDKVKICNISNDELDNLLPFGAVHQGVALLSILKDVSDTQDYIKTTKPVIVLDGLNDPQNIGAILRTCAAFGVEHLIVQQKGSPEITGAMAKAAAGAVEKVRIHRVVNLSRVLEEFKNNNFMVYGADGHSDTTISDVKFSPKSVIVMGAEGDGMRRLIKDNCDTIIKIPISPQAESLNVSNAFAIILYVATL